jgi:hypothetical protein
MDALHILCLNLESDTGQQSGMPRSIAILSSASRLARVGFLHSPYAVTSWSQRMRQVVAVLVGLTTLGAPALLAQQLRGIVRDSTVGNALAGAIVQVLDSSGRGSGRAITDVDGRFALSIAPASARLRVVRIGYRPSDTAIPSRRAGPIEIRMGRIPPMLDVVRVNDTGLCPGSPERGAAFEIWQQARTGLLAAVVARELNPAQATTLTYTTTLSPNDERVRRQTKKLTRGRTTRPFVASAAPSFFARMGYMLESGPDRLFNAPDADVLIDESFAATHCFRLRAADDAHRGQVGVAFKPVAGRDTLVDVEGVIWMTANTPELRSLDFTYTSLEPAAMDASSGGHIEFRTMKNGVTFIDRWNLRLASLVPPAGGIRRNATSATRMRRTDLREMRVKELVDGGGVVLTASWPDGTRWNAVKSAVSGVVVAKGTGRPVVARVSLAGTPDTVVTDSTGHFRIETLPGKYFLQAIDTTFAAFVEPRSESTPVEIRLGQDTTTRLEMSGIDAIVDDLCRGRSMPQGSGVVIGVVAARSGELPRDAFIEAVFEHINSVTDFSKTTQKISVDDRGRFVVCGTPRDRRVQLTLETPKGAIADTSVIVPLATVAERFLWVVPVPPR